jgi:uncharacterized phage protein (TIGR01671 family)
METILTIERDDDIDRPGFDIEDDPPDLTQDELLNLPVQLSTNMADLYDDDDKHVIVMESTGMKDCKGNEIFEGDILYVRYREQDYGGKVFHHQVIWNTKEGMWGTNGGMGYENGSLARHLEMYFCLVAGNIYQDKDLTRLLRR